jgi:low temperature requirement protein LtrA
MSVSIPEAFAERGLLFACAYVSMQVGRTIFFLYAIRHSAANFVRSFQRILVWLCFSAIFWILGGFAEGQQRYLFWCIAFTIEFISPAALFWVPGLGRSSTTDWDVEGNHMAERCALFVIIALGESLLVTGATFAHQTWNNSVIAAFLSAVFGSLALWWIYFDSGLQRAHHRILHSVDPGRQARLAYTYMHAPIVAGIIVCAVADELVLAHPGHATGAAIMAIIGGPALYLLGCLLFKWVTNDRLTPPLSHLAGLGLLATLVPITLLYHLSALLISFATTVILIMVAVWESLALRVSKVNLVHK